MTSLVNSFLLFSIFTIFIGESVGDGEFNVPIKKAPYKVLIVLSKNNSHVVGAGAIISEHWAITTATCVEEHRGNPTTLMVRSGSGLYNVNGGLHFVKQIIVHPDFVGKDASLIGRGDVALLRLLASFKLSLTVSPIPIPSQVTPAGAQAHIISWPLLDDKRSSTLKAISLTIIDWVECQNALNQQAAIALMDTTVCSSPVANAQEGDPLVTSGTLTGLYKDISTAAHQALPQCYIDIASFMPWIKDNTKE